MMIVLFLAFKRFLILKTKGTIDEYENPLAICFDKYEINFAWKIIRCFWMFLVVVEDHWEHSRIIRQTLKWV
jgi:hypothetical protein